MNPEIVKCPCGNASMTYYVAGEDLWTAVAVNTKITKEGCGNSCRCKKCGMNYDGFDPCMIADIDYKDKLTPEDLSEEEFSPVHLLPESNESILNEMNEPIGAPFDELGCFNPETEDRWPGYERPYQVKGEAWMIKTTQND